MMERQILFILLAVFSIAFSSCKKHETLSDYASKIEGDYIGTLTVTGSASSSAYSVLTERSETTVDLIVDDGIHPINHLVNGINVSLSGNTYNLSRGSDFVGKVDGNNLTWTFNDAIRSQTFTFSGILYLIVI